MASTRPRTLARMAPSLDRSTSNPPPAPARAVLEELVNCACAAIDGQLSSFAQGLATALLDLDAAAGDVQLAYQRTRAGKLLASQRYAFVQQAGAAIARHLRAELTQLTPATSAPALADTLSLVPLAVTDQQVAFSVLCRPFEIEHAELLASLCIRLGLLLGRDALRPAQNPFRPEIFLNAVQSAWSDFASEPEFQPLLTPLLRPELFLALGPVLRSLDDALRAHSRQARNKLPFQKTLDAKRSQPGMDAALAQHLRQLLGGAENPAAALVPELPNMPQGNGWRPHAAAPSQQARAASASLPGSPGPGVAGPVALPASGMAPASLLDLLAKFQASEATVLPLSAAASGTAAASPNVFYLPRLKQSLPAGSLSRGEENTLDLLSRIFETVLLDDSIPPETRELFRFLQVPVLKAALLDQNFFFEEAHPARRMIDLLSRMGWEQRQEASDPVVQAMRRGVARIGDAADAQPQAFAAAVADLEAQLAAEQRATEDAIAAPIARATQIEQQATAARLARACLAPRLAAPELAPLLAPFLAQRWSAVLTFAHLIDAARPGAIDNATRTMDELIWSLKPKLSVEQRRALIGRLPGLLAALSKWLDAVKWQDAERVQFFAELAGQHLMIVRAPLEGSPERQLELTLAAARDDALRQIALEQAEAAQDVADANAADAAQDAALALVAQLERGMRLEFRQADGSVRKLKLAWVSPLRTLFIFSGGSQQAAFSLAAEQLLQAVRAGSIALAPFEGVVGRVLNDAMRQAVNDPAPLRAAS